jgi:hypothetical protein
MTAEMLEPVQNDGKNVQAALSALVDEVDGFEE